VANRERAGQLAEVGVILLMFGAGVMLRRLGATPEQTDLERERARAALYGPEG
jgi:hypothetical protein